MKVALVHDDFVQAGGAESLFATIASIWPKAPIYTSFVDWKKLPSTINRDRIRPSWMQKIPFAAKLYKALLPLYPLAFESFNFNEFDLVISSTTRFAKSIITQPRTMHICYMNSIPRFLYGRKAQADYLPIMLRLIFKPILIWLKRWDKVSSCRPDLFVANSANISKKIKKFYERESEVIYPFVDLNFFQVAKVHNWELKSQNYFLVVTRLVKWKKIDIAIKAISNMGKSLKIVGEGPDRSRLKRLVRDDRTGDIEFLGRVTREQLRELYQNCQALIVTQEEDFGIAAVEAQACGIPVIAYRQSGVSETVEDGRTGILFDNQSAQALQDAIGRLSRVKWKIQVCRKNATRFSKKHFIEELERYVSQVSEVPQVSYA